MQTTEQLMADSTNPNGKSGISVNFLPNFYKTDANKKFLQATVDQLIQPGTVKKINGYVGRQNSKATTGSDVFVDAADAVRQHYQLEPGLVVNDALGNTTFFRDYIDYINQLNVFGANTQNHARLNKQEFYSWDPHIDWDKFVNFQNYYWLPYGPDTIRIFGQQANVISEYTVDIKALGGINQYIFTPNGITVNPVLRLYRGQTYTFKINSTGNPFSIMTERTTGPQHRYIIGGIDNYGIENGTVTFTVPKNAPQILFYQSESDPILGGAIEILDVDENSVIDVEKDVLGKAKYTLSNGTQLSNGMKVSFGGQVTPVKYAVSEYYVEGVGTAIKLIDKRILEVSSTYSVAESILFDATNFDVEPFSDSTGFAQQLDYITINRASNDHNHWSRYNRWFHKDTVNASSAFNGNIAELDQNARAVRPIIEFDADLKLFNFGTRAIPDVDLIDTFTKDVFSTINGTKGYNIDGIPVSDGHKILFTADTDRLVKNKIYQVKFVNILGYRQIRLDEVAEPSLNQTVLVKSGIKNQGRMYWYTGSTWQVCQEKIDTNQCPLFDIVDDNNVSFGDTSVYAGSTFIGTKVFSYKIGHGITDTHLGFSLSYKNINNIGDIVFNFNLASDTFNYKTNNTIVTMKIDTGYLVSQDYPGNALYVNGWQTCASDTVQAAVRIYRNSGSTNNFELDIFDDILNLSDLTVKIYINGVRLKQSAWQIVDGPKYKKIILGSDISTTDVLSIRAFTAQPVNANGYYEIPVNLQNNPLNDDVTNFTLGEVIDHVNSIVDNIPGTFDDIRNLGNITQYGTKFVQHSGPASLSLYHITSQSNNIVRALEESRDDYGVFKRNFIVAAENLGVEADPVRLVDLALQKINKDKSSAFPYYFSDMVPYGAKISTKLTVVDYRIKSYPLTNVFSLDKLSNQAVGVYLNGVQLLVERDYTFDSQGFVIITATLHNNDTITICEYDSTDGCFVPETPTKLGIWPKYEPRIYTDTSLVTPRVMIQGHDGSQVLAYGDYRDQLILELEKRIYNNIKIKYNTDIYDIADIIPSYNRTNDYTLDEFNQVLAPNFYRWSGLVDKDFSKPLSYNRSNNFTFNYVGHYAPDGRNIPGYWRGIFRWMLDSDRPNICPWEMLGFSVEPKWWTSVYGPAPYTSDNKIMWEDISKGTVREPGVPAVILPKYIKPFLMDCIPVDQNGLLLDPLNSGLVRGITTNLTSTAFVFGDMSPVEGTWRRSSYYPFSVIIASMLLTPAKTFGTLLDRSRIVRNRTGQLVYSSTGLRIRSQDVVLPSIYSSNTRVQTSGIINYIVNYILNDTLKSYTTYEYDLNNITAQISHRIGAFTSKEKFNLLLDSKTPLSQGSVFVPQEDFNIILNSSSPVKKIVYSGVIITKLTDGYEVKGYSKTDPYFKYYSYLQSGTTINIGGISENYTTWTPNEQYVSGKVIKFNNAYYRSKSLHTTTTAFDPNFYAVLGGLPVIGGRTVTLRKLWDRTSSIVVPYGSKFETEQEVTDFLIGYGEYLKDQGFVFDEFNTVLNAVTNWETSAKEFLFWTTQNWSGGQDKWDEWLPNQPIAFNSIVRFNGDYYRALRNVQPSTTFSEENFVKLDGLSTVGSGVISLSPSATKLTFTTKLSVVDDIRNSFNGYEIFKVDGLPLEEHFLNSYRQDNTVSYSPRSNDGIYGATFYLVQKEQVLILKNKTMFNDTIYNPESGYKQDRIKVAGYVSTDWYGGFDVPGFIFDQALVKAWTAWTDYALGDIVKYQSFYYSANSFLPGTEKFQPTSWVRLLKQPTASLLPNWTYKATQFTDFYSLDSDNFDGTQQKVAQHLIGYQKRQYLENIIQDDVSEFKFYQGMIREKGTQNVLNKLFDVLSSSNKESLVFDEEWAIRVGQYGASDAFENIEFIIDEGLFKNNPQGFELVKQKDPNIYDLIIRQTPNDVYLKPIGYNSSPWPVLKTYNPFLRSAGYVNSSDVFLSIDSLKDILTQDVTTFSVGAYVWTTFDSPPLFWNIYKYVNSNIAVTNVTYDGTGVLTVTTNATVDLAEGDYIGITGVETFAGFCQIASIDGASFTINKVVRGFPDIFSEQATIQIFKFVSQRTTTIDNSVSLDRVAGELIWTDDSGDSKWATWMYTPAYTVTDIPNTSPADGLGYGSALVVNDLGTLAVVGTATGELVTYDKIVQMLPWTQRQTISNTFIANNVLGNDPNDPSVVGTVLAISEDSQWLAVGSPQAGYASTRYVGSWALALTPYYIGDIVSDFGAAPSTFDNPGFYVALQNMTSGHPIVDANGKLIPDPVYWERISYIPVSTTGVNSSLASQGVVSLYQKDANNIFTLVDTFISPEPQSNQLFGSSIVFSGSNLYIGAPGYHNGLNFYGAVYKLTYSTVVNKSSSYNPVGSLGEILVVSSTAGVRVGMTVVGSGFTKGQSVVAIINSTTLALSAKPDGIPSGVLKFETTGWTVDNSRLVGAVNHGNFGQNLVVAKDNSKLIVSAPTSSTTSSVYVFKNVGNSLVLAQPRITGISANFGSSIGVSNDGTYMLIASPTQSVVNIYKWSEDHYVTTPVQVLTNYRGSGSFGQKVSFMNNYKTIVVFNGNGITDVYDRYLNTWIYSETLTSTNLTEDYGVSFFVGSNIVLIGDPLSVVSGLTSGRVYSYQKENNSFSWTIHHREIEKVDVKKIKKAFLYNRTNNTLITHIDIVDPLQGKVPGPAEEEINYKTFYDPAVYTVGTDSVTTDAGTAWTKTHVGTLWWDLRTAKFINAYEDDVVYRNSIWNTLAPNASIDVYEWVETTYLPNAWDAQADTAVGLALGISGTSLYGNTTYSIRQKYDTISQTFKNTYYYWVKNKKTIPAISSRNLSAADVASLIANPRGQGYQYLALTGLNSFSLVNFKSSLKSTDVVLSVEYWLNDKVDQNIHSQWKIISTNPGTILPSTIEQKWIDSLCGRDSNDLQIPDMLLPVKIRYGVQNRPRQSMFVNRFEALKQIIEQTNLFLVKDRIIENKNLSALQSYDKEPSLITGQYDTVFDTDAELRFANVGSFKRPSITPVIVNGSITGINILENGRGYLQAPYFQIHGTGINAVVRATINVLGQITGATIINGGVGYDNSTVVTIRDYSVLVHSDSQADNVWSIYSYDPTAQLWSRINSKTYDVRDYWNYIDWYATGYNQYTVVDYAVNTLLDLNALSVNVGQAVKIINNGSGNWILLEKYSNVKSEDWIKMYNLVGVQNGTLQFSSLLYKFISTGIGYDGSTYDGVNFDNVASRELRIILTALRDDIFIEELKSQYLSLFFTSVRYALSEQTYIDWIFKTSFVKGTHNVGELNQPVTYQPDNLNNFEDYVNEVKPYRTTIREYVSAYDKTDMGEISVTDFDLPTVYENQNLASIGTWISNGKIQADDPAIQTYPWKFWLDNVGFKITELKLTSGGSGYLTEPKVIISSDSGSGATARAFFTNGVVNRIILQKPGSGYLSAPTVSIVGGLSDKGVAATAVAIIGDSVVRSTAITMKFDRVSRTNLITQLGETETLTGSGSRLQFQLKWAPDVRIGHTSVTVNNVEVLRNSYKLSIVSSTEKGYTTYSGLLTFKSAPASGISIVVNYVKDWSLLNAVDRIQYYYNPQTGDLGKDFAQLMTGIDYGGVIVNGLGFDVSSGWGSLPYYSDKWDTFDATFDDYSVTVPANTYSITLPYVPAVGVEFNFYYQAFDNLLFTSDGTTTRYDFDVFKTVNYVTLSHTVNTTLATAVGSKIIHVDSTSDLEVGDELFVDGAAFGYGTKISRIISNSIIELNFVMLAIIPSGSVITYVRRLSELAGIKLNIYAVGYITLSKPAPAGTTITVNESYDPVRIDDPDFGTPDQTNINAVMQTVIGDGVTSTFTVPDAFTVNAGDRYYVRKSTSDGSKKPQEADYDTALTGGDFAYSTATGLSADDLLIDGDGFASPTTNSAPEEVVPGQVVDTLAIKVFDRPQTGSATIKVDNYFATGSATQFAISQTPNSPEAVIVKINSIIKTYGTDYTIDYPNKLINFSVVPNANDLVTIFSIGFNGSNILDLDYFVGDGTTKEFVTKAPWTGTVTSLVYLDGHVVTPELFKTDSTYDEINQIGIRFIDAPAVGALINFIIVNGSQQTFAITNREVVATNGSTTYKLQYPVGDSLPNETSMIVRVDQAILEAPNNSYFTIGKNRLNYTIDTTKFVPYSVNINNIVVLADGVRLQLGSDYTVDLSGITVKISRGVYTTYSSKNLIVSITSNQGYVYVPASGNIIFSQAYDNTHEVEVISSYRHDILDIQRTEINVTSSIALAPDTVEYYYYKSVSSGLITLDRTVIDNNYVWLIKNGSLLTPSVDYKLNDDMQTVQLAIEPDPNDRITVITFGSNVLTSGISYLQFKDMLNRVHFKRLNLNKRTQLVHDLNYNDVTITVANASSFDLPNPTQNRPGVIEIQGERIEFFEIQDNVLSKLRRGTLGTGVRPVHKAGSFVQELGSSESIPYIENTVTERVESDGTNIVNLNFTPTLDETSFVKWFREYGYSFEGEYNLGLRYNINFVVTYNNLYYRCVKTVPALDYRVKDIDYTTANPIYWNLFDGTIPTGYGQSNDIEVFVGGYDSSVTWSSGVEYKVGKIVIVGSYTYRCVVDHISSKVFADDSDYWQFFIGNIRLKKKPYKVHNVNSAPYSPEGDVQLEADFAVDGANKQVRLTHKLAAGTYVTVVKREGTDWDSTENIQFSDSKIARFLKAAPGVWHTDFKH